MSLTSYRAAPPRGSGFGEGLREGGGLRAWRRPTLPHLEVQYHWRRGFSRPSSGWDRVFGPSLWPPGRQFRSPEGRPLGGVFRGCHVRRSVCGPLGPPFAAFAGTSFTGASCPAPGFCGDRFARQRVLPLCATVGIKANRAISTGQLNGLLRFHLRPIDVVVFHGSRRDLVLRRVSRLDAFSGYPVRT